jgi:DNA-binding transcriptional LysR family regulator
MDWTDRIGRRIRLRDLHIVLAVAEAGSMAKASARLAISHPVVSKTISDLEHTLGIRLFDRKPQGVELTAYGRALIKCGTTVFDEMRQGLKQIDFWPIRIRVICVSDARTSISPESFPKSSTDFTANILAYGCK